MAATLKSYHVGIIDDAPAHSMSFGGVNFPRFTEVVTASDSTRARSQRLRRPGAYVKLTDAELETVNASIERTIIRRNGNQGMRLDTTHPFFRPDDNHDEPASRYIYIKEVEPEASAALMDTPATLDEVRADPAAPAEERAAKAEPEDKATRRRHRRAKKSGDAVDRDQLQG